MKELQPTEQAGIVNAMGKKLEEHGWGVWERTSPCPKCNRTFVDEGKYCPRCGTLLPLSQAQHPAYAELFAAFLAGYAVYETVTDDGSNIEAVSEKSNSNCIKS